MSSIDLEIKVFARMRENLQHVEKTIGDLATATNAMRLALATATLTMGECEALHLRQGHEKRNRDSELFELRERVEGLRGRADVATKKACAELPKIENLRTQAKRANDRDIAVGRILPPPTEGVEYVDLNWWATELRSSAQQVRALIEQGEIPEPDACESTAGRAKQLWLWGKAALRAKSILQRREVA